MRPLETTILGSLLMILLLSSHVQSDRNEDSIESEKNEEQKHPVFAWVLGHLANLNRNKRIKMNVGFLSRYSVLNRLSEAQDAARDAEDPYGPGRRK